MSAVTTPKKAGRPKSNRPKPNHPPYADMVAQAIATMKDKRGSSGIAIKKYVLSHFDVPDSDTTNKHINLALKRGVTSGSLVTARGHAGTFRNSQESKKAAAASSKKSVVTPKLTPKKDATPKKAAKKTTTKSAKKTLSKVKTLTKAARKTPVKAKKAKRATPKRFKKPAKVKTMAKK